ncbi:MAG: UvrD-helicase domain-containing protein [Dehalococcoidia bacterium]
MSDAATPLADQAARDAIAGDLGRTLFVEAGAGTGKTTALVMRIVSLVTSGTARLEAMAVITFTRPAAAELREKVREALEERLSRNGVGESELARLEAAIEEIDYAAIQTIDGFALSLLRERPLEAGLPPVIEPRDEIEAALAFDDAWREWLAGALERDGLGDLLGRAARLGLDGPVDGAREIAARFHANYDLLEGVRFRETGATPRIASDRLLGAIPRLRELAAYCVNDDDRLMQRLEEVFEFAAEVADADEGDRPYLWTHAPSLRVSTVGSAANWDEAPEGGKAHVRVRDQLAGLRAIVESELAELRRDVLGELTQQVAGFAREYAARRREDGLADFHDLLVWACDMLRTSPSARAHFRARYPHVLIDEFQDTDPRQVSLALLLTGPDEEAVPDPGALFVVGDPKQSIYGWRRADLPTVMAVRSRLEDGLLYLRQNFRTHRRLVEWVNGVFASWIGQTTSAHQADYVPLETGLEPPGPDWGAATVGGALPDLNLPQIREQEAQEIARIALSVGNGGWRVRDGGGGVRPSEFRDLVVLMRTRTGLPALQQALEDAGVPFILAGQSMVFATQEVRDLAAALAAIDDPSDQVALIAALRSPAYGCSDLELWEWAKQGGAFDYTSALPDGGEGADGPVARAFRSLRGFHERRMTESAPELIERFIRERRLRELALGSVRARERLRHLGIVIESARALAGAQRPSLREFLAWMRERADERTRVTDAAGSESRENAVRLMTVHAAKGLEFPIVVLTGLNSQPRAGRAAVLFDYRAGPEKRLGVRLGTQTAEFTSANYEALKDRAGDAAAYEDARLMYVACTRAKDHLVVSLYRRADDTKSLAARLALHAEGLSGLSRNLSPVPEVAPAAETAPSAPATVAAGTLAERAAWIEERSRALARAGRSTVVGASSLGERRAEKAAPAAFEKSEAEEREAEPWRRGRGGSAMGRAVHAVLQEVDLDEMSLLTELAERHARAHGLGQDTEGVRRLADAVLGTAVMRRAAAADARGRCWREVYTSVPLGDGRTALEGFIDLIFEEEDGTLTIVDYKTDQIPPDGSLEDVAAPYRPQLGAYVAAAERAAGRRVGRAVLVFARRAFRGLEAEWEIPDPSAAARHALQLAEDAVAQR